MAPGQHPLERAGGAWARRACGVAAALACVCAWVAACGGEGPTDPGGGGGSVEPPPGPAAVAQVAVAPESLVTTVGQTARLAATPLDSAGRPLAGRTVAWASSDTLRVRVGADGTVTAVDTGAAVVTALAEGRSGTARVRVVVVPIAAIEVRLPAESVAVHDTLALAATPKDAGGDPLAGRAVTWSGLDPTATVLADGRVIGAAEGDARVVATAEDRADTVRIRVTPARVARVVITPAADTVVAGQAVALQATALGAAGEPLAGRAIAWSSLDPSLASVAADGAVAGQAPGTARIVASAEGKADTARVKVLPPPGVYTDIVSTTYCTGPKTTGGTVSLKLDVLYPKVPTSGPLPVALWVHGGAWQGDNVASPLYPEIRDTLLARGWAVVPIHYRLSNTTNGLGPAPWPAPLEDAKCAVRWLRAHADSLHLDPARIGAWGQSAGGHIVAALATVPEGTSEGTGGWAGVSSRVRAVAVLAPITDLTRASEVAGIQSTALRNEFPAWPDTTAAAIADASPVRWVSSDDVPFLIVHGDADATVSVKQSARLDSLLTAAGVPSTLVVVAGGDHSFTVGSPSPAETVRRVAGFFDERVR